MKVLVTGTSGRLVSYLRNYVQLKKPDWVFEFISLRNDDWKKKDLSEYESIIHCAGITSAPDDDYEQFYRINVILTKELFEECIRQGVRHFIYLSSMAVYDGIGWGFGKDGLITEQTVPAQKSNYGKSKYEAEKALRTAGIGKVDTKVAVVRAPSIVGGGLEAYFDRYVQFASIPVVPVPWIHTEAKRSFVYIDTLIEFICELALDGSEGLFFPQNFPLLSVSEMMLEVCKAAGKEKRTSKALGKLMPDKVQKRFFSQICYEESLSSSNLFHEISSREAIERTIKENALL